MPRFRLLAALLVGITALSLTACEDPTSVGLDIIGDRGGEPQVHVLPPSQFAPAHVAEVTGNNDRTLLGHLDDPVLGTIRSHAYVDYLAPSTGSDFRSGTVDFAAIELARSYVVGDTTGEIAITLYDMAEDWNPQGASSDTSFARGAQIATYTFSAADTLVTLELPSDWIARNDTTLRSTSFSSVFHGFHFEATGGNAVIGFSATASRLRAAAGADSASYPMAKNLTAVNFDESADLPDDRLVVQGAGGRAIEAVFNVDSLREDFALNRAILRVQEDSLLSRSQLPAHHVRPRASQLNLYVRLGDGTLAQIDAAARNDRGEYEFRSTDFRMIFDQYLRGERNIDALVLRVPTTPNSLDHLLIRTEEADSPRLTLTLTPLLD